MPQTAVSAPVAQRRGILLLAAGIFAFTAMDALAKHLVGHYPATEVVWARYLGQLVFVILYLRTRLGLAVTTRFPLWHVARATAQLGTTGLFFFSLGFVGLAQATALADINPVLITLGAALFLGERLSRTRILGLAVAVIGAAIVIRPGLGVFSAPALLPLGAAFSFAANVLITRHLAPKESPWAALFFPAVFGVVATSLVLPFQFRPVPPADIAGFALLGLLGAGAQLLIIRAYALAEAASLAPFGYLDMVFASFWSVMVYADWPDGPTLFGALVIALAGLYVFRAETRRPENRRPENRRPKNRRPAIRT